MTSQHTADYPTLQEVLRLPVFAGCTVCGGAAGLGRRVSGVNLTDTPDYARWLAQGELLITTGFAIADDPQAVDALLPTAAEKGLSGVGIKPGRYLPSPLPAALAEKADRLGLPLLQLPTDMRFAELADAVSREIARRRIPAEQERQLAVLLHHLISGAPLSEAMERQAAESGIHLECPHILMWIQADAPELQRRSWLHEVEERYRALGADMWGALSEDGFLLALEADDLFALEMPLRRGDGGLCRRPRRYLRRQPPLRRYGGFSESRPQCPHGAPHGGANGNTLRDRRPSGGGTAAGGILPGGNGRLYPSAAGNAPAAARAAAARAAGHAGELAALYGQPAPDGAGAAPALQHRELPAPAAMVAAGGRSGRSDEAIGIGNGPVSVPVQAHIKE